MKPEDILNIFIEQHRICSQFDPEADPFAELCFASTVEEWRNANDLIPWQPLSEFLNEEFDISITKEQWQLTLTPSHKRTLKDVCELIAKSRSQHNIVPIKLLGHHCLSAAIFLTLKKQLKRRNVDTSKLKPSSLITPYLENNFSEVLEQTTIISKGQKVFDDFLLKRKKRGVLNYINIFDKNRYTFFTGEIKTFRDLTYKIIEVQNIENKAAT